MQSLSYVTELVTNIKRACIRGRNVAGDPETREASNFIATCDHIESMADQALAELAKEPTP